jgi:Winged helix-turn helix
VLHEVEQGHRQQREAARRLRLSDRQVRRLQARLRQQGDGGLMHGLRGRRSNHKISEVVQRRGALRQLSRSCYVGFGPTLAAEHLAKNGIVVSRETLRKWMGPAGLWKSRPARVKALHVWRPRRASFGEIGHDGQLPISLAGRSRPGWPSDRQDRRCHQPRVGAFGSARFDGRKSAHFAGVVAPLGPTSRASDSFPSDA